MADIFISYAREDHAQAARLARQFEAQDWSVWWDRTIPTGRTFDEVIEEAIDGAKCIMVLWSEHSVSSRWVRTEAQEGMDRNVLTPVLIQDCKIPLAFRRIQAADLIQWDGQPQAESFQRLIQDVARLLGPPPVVEQERLRQEEERQRRAEAERKRNANEDEQRRLAEAQRKAEEDEQRRQAEAERKRKAALEEERRRTTQRPQPAPTALAVESPSSTAQERQKPTSTRSQVDAGTTATLTPSPAPGRSPSRRSRKPRHSHFRTIAVALAAVAIIVVAGIVVSRPRAAIPTVTFLVVPARITQGDSAELTWSAAGAAEVDLRPGFGRVAAKGSQWVAPESDVAYRIIARGPGGSTEDTVHIFVIVTFRDCPVCPEMVEIPAGRFTMGSPASEHGRSSAEGPQHEVTIRRFALGKYVVTQAEYMVFAQEQGVEWPEPEFGQTDSHPAVYVNWEDAQLYGTWLSARTGKSYRLPSESEWEYAARATTTTARFWGEDPDEACAYGNVSDETGKAEHGWEWIVHNCRDGYVQNAPVGSFQANAFGLHDMLGNISEWVERMCPCTRIPGSLRGGGKTGEKGYRHPHPRRLGLLLQPGSTYSRWW